MRFGRLTVIEKAGKRHSDRTIVWRCKCDCGKETCVPSTNLRKAHTVSCGCYREERRKPKALQWGKSLRNSELRKKGWPTSKKNLGMVEKTNLSYMENAKVRSDNKTGVRGVTIEKGKFVATIRFNGVRRRLGTFGSLKEAETARKDAEDAIVTEIERLKRELDAAP